MKTLEMVVSNKTDTHTLTFTQGQNSLGEPGWFINNPPDVFKEIHGYPDYAVEQWMVDRGWKYNWD